jgi:hypothetical protein
MKLRTGVKLWVEPLCDRIVPSTTPTYIEPDPVALQDPSQTTNTTPPTTPTSPTGTQQYIGIDPINPLPGINLAPPPEMPVDPTKEAAILVALNAKISELQAEIADLDPTSSGYESELENRQERIGRMQMAIVATQGIAANVLTFYEMLPHLLSIRAQILHYVDNPPTSPQEAANLAMLLAQYNNLHAQMTELIHSTVSLMTIRSNLMNTENMDDGY